jgi:hypothetical protein
MNREESWAKERKAIKHWKLTNAFWTAMEKGLHGYTRNPKGEEINTPFPKHTITDGTTSSWHSGNKIRLDLLKGRIGRQWIAYVKQNIQNENIKLQAK